MTARGPWFPAPAVRETPSVIENTWAAIEAALRPIVQDDAGAKEVASAFYDVAWVPLDSTAQTYGEAVDEEGTFSLSWRNAGELVARLRGRGESYMDWCWEAESEVVSERVERVMRSLGLRPVI